MRVRGRGSRRVRSFFMVWIFEGDVCVCDFFVVEFCVFV